MSPLVLRRRLPGVLVAGVAAATVLLVIGSLGLWLASSRGEIEPAAPPTSLPRLDPPPLPNALPDIGLNDVPAFEATVRYELGGRDGTPEASTVDVLVSYQPPESFRREILTLDPPDMEFWRGAVGDYVASDGTFQINTGETTQEGEVLGPLVWSNWDATCTQPAVPVETIITGRTLTTVRCDDPVSPWTIVVDRHSGLVLRAEAELPGDDFAIPGIGFEIVSLTYEPDFASNWFATPETPPSAAIPGEPMIFTFTEELDGRTAVATVTWQDDATWRLDVVSGSLGSADPGSYLIYTDQTLFTYDAGSNEFLEERFPALEGRRNLVRTDCSESGTCTLDDIEIICETTPNDRVAGRPVTRYDCNWPAPYSPSVAWIDDKLGYTLKDREGFEVTAIELNPVINPAEFEQVCPTTDCAPVDTG